MRDRKTVSINEDDIRRAEEHDRKAKPAKKDNRFKDSWKIPTRYDLRQLLGSGAYGNVAEAKDTEKKRRVAIKQAKHLLDDLIDAKRILREIAILGKLDHPHVVKLYDVVVPHDLRRFNEIYVVLELADSDLKKLCRADVYLSHAHIHSLMYNMLVGINYLHSAGIWHRDLKPANCLVNEDCCVKICDFGLARAVGGETPDLDGPEGGEKRQLTGHVVTRWYRAPELILLQDSYTEAIDVWSAACIFAELLMMLEGQKYEERGPLFPGHTCFPLSPHEGHRNDTRYYTKGTRDQLSMICNLIGTPSSEDVMAIEGEDAQCYMKCFGKKPGGGVKERFGGMDPKGSDLLEQMLVFNPAKRLSIAEALLHPIFTSLRDARLEFTAADKVTLDFEKESELDERRLRALFLEEVAKFHPDMQR
mmetsp:Transcript_54976/g.117323  ORF Transcript_54976/g.117323 Transcript_54976/m.117323 type:complete len:419 (+) Transcript_54976:181-1437(+)